MGEGSPEPPQQTAPVMVVVIMGVSVIGMPMGAVSVRVMAMCMVVIMMPRFRKRRNEALPVILPLDVYTRFEFVGLGDLAGGFQVIALLTETEGLFAAIAPCCRQCHCAGGQGHGGLTVTVEKIEAEAGRYPGLEDTDLQESIGVNQQRPAVASVVCTLMFAVVMAMTLFGEQAGQPLAA